jgi:hypothetical protein
MWVVIDAADLPNDLIGIEDLRRFGISLIEGRAVSLYRHADGLSQSPG